MHRRALPRGRKDSEQTPFRRNVEAFWRMLMASNQAGLVLVCLVSVLGFNLVFAIRSSGIFWLVPGSLPFTALLGGGLYLFFGLLGRLQLRVAAGVGRIQAAFLMFFLFLPTLVGLYFLLLAWPMGFLLRTFAGSVQAQDYRRWILDLAAIQAMVFWAWVARRRVRV